MKLLPIILLVVLAGCASSDPYRVNSFSPKANKISCPSGSVAVVHKYGGGRLKSVGGERWSCEDPDAIDRETMASEDGWDEGE